MQTLLIIIKTFFDICLWRKRPQDLPASPEFLFMCMLAYTISGILLTGSSQPFAVAIGAGVFETLLLLLLVYSILKLRALPQRWTQTCTALAGIGTIFCIMAMPLFYWFANVEQGSAIGQEFYLLLFALVVWNVSVMAHIFKHSLSISFPVSVVVSILLIWCMTAMSSMIFPRQVL